MAEGSALTYITIMTRAHTVRTHKTFAVFITWLLLRPWIKKRSNRTRETGNMAAFCFEPMEKIKEMKHSRYKTTTLGFV